VKRTFLSILVLFLVAFGIVGAQLLAPTMTPEAAGEEQATDLREEELLRRSTARPARARGNRVRPLINTFTILSGSFFATGTFVPSRSFCQSKFPPGRFNLLQVCRI